jgi:ZIP family zinc transporter
VPRTVVASVMAFGAGVLISALAFDLVDDAEKTGGLQATFFGFLAGALAYVVGNLLLARRGAAHRKSAGEEQMSESEQAGSGTAIALGALLDGVPESAALGLSLLTGEGVGIAVLANDPSPASEALVLEIGDHLVKYAQLSVVSS